MPWMIFLNLQRYEYFLNLCMVCEGDLSVVVKKCGLGMRGLRALCVSIGKLRDALQETFVSLQPKT